jgi:hypothetical protein
MLQAGGVGLNGPCHNAQLQRDLAIGFFLQNQSENFAFALTHFHRLAKRAALGFRQQWFHGTLRVVVKP